MLEAVGNEGHVYFGRAMHLFGWAYSHHNAHYRRIVEAMDRLSAEVLATTQVCGLRGNKYIVLDSRDGPGPFRITSDVGAEVPIPWTASGRLLLDHLSEREILDFIPPEDFVLPDGRELSIAGFLEDVAKARRDGYCETTGLADRFTWCMAAPIRDAHGIAGKTLCLVLSMETPPTRREELLQKLLKTSAGLSLDQG
jgi:DNA-binding IclR family transcriptional regulator